MSKAVAALTECFSSIQGEGILVGMRQVFLRFSGCNLACSYCDTPGVSDLPAECLLETTPGRRDFVTVANPVAGERIVALIDGWTRQWPGIHHSISVTGGEPLLHGEALQEWLPALQRLLPVHLETNGTLPDALAAIIPYVDYVGMDIKLPSAAGTPELWREHEAFLAVAAQKKVYVKVVVDEHTTVEEIARCCDMTAAVDASIPMILQPVTLEGGSIAISAMKTLELQETASSQLKEVRVIPQTHKFMGQL